MIDEKEAQAQETDESELVPETEVEDESDVKAEDSVADVVAEEEHDKGGSEEQAAAPAPAAPEAAPTADENPSLKWYVVHTYSGHEQKAKRHLESAIETSGFQDKFGRVIVPTEQVTEMKQGKKSTSTRKFLPSYILVEVELDNESRHLVVNTPGITNFVGGGGKPQALELNEVEHIIGHMEKGPVLKTDEMPYSAGDAVKVTDGPFADFSGIVSEVIPERKKLKVMVSIFGRPTPVELDYLQVQPV
jgi:transcriptional antiterminator NusG